jgi:hypothetical protein
VPWSKNYSGKEANLLDLLEKNKGKVEKLIRGIVGFVAHSLVHALTEGSRYQSL